MLSALGENVSEFGHMIFRHRPWIANHRSVTWVPFVKIKQHVVKVTRMYVALSLRKRDTFSLILSVTERVDLTRFHAVYSYVTACMLRTSERWLSTDFSCSVHGRCWSRARKCISSKTANQTRITLYSKSSILTCSAFKYFLCNMSKAPTLRCTPGKQSWS